MDRWVIAVTSQAGWGGEPCCAGSASPGTDPAKPPHARDPSGLVFLGRSSSPSELPFRSQPQPHTHKSILSGHTSFLCFPSPRRKTVPLHPGELMRSPADRRDQKSASQFFIPNHLSTGFEEDQGL